jgi:putative tricarboxylic transport membrane protein
VRFRRPVPLLLALSALCLAHPAAQQSPARVDHLVIVAPAAPGGGWDQTARALQHVIDVHGLSRVVEVQNVPGAAGTIGLSQFVDARKGSGEALLVTGLVMVGATAWNDSPVSVNQATPIARLTGEYEVIAVPASSPLRDLPALVAEFQKRPEAFAWGGGSAGGTDHILAGLLAEAAGVDPRRVNYVAFSGGGEAVAALMGGHVAAGISGYSEFAAHIASGRLRALAISSPSRRPGLDVPTIKESGLDVEMSNWRGVLAPAGISDRDRATLTALVRDAVESDDWRRILAAREWDDQYLDGEPFAAFLRAEQNRFTPIVARLRGPGRGETIAAGRTLVPVVVLVVLGVVIAIVTLQRFRERSRVPVHKPAPDGRAVLSVASALVLFLVMLTPAGFVAASTALFVIVARAFERLSPDGDSARPPRRTIWIVAPVFCLAVYFAFTRGLDLPLPEARFWSWMR